MVDLQSAYYSVLVSKSYRNSIWEEEAILK